MWFFFFKQKTAYELRISDWSSDACSSDLALDRDLVIIAVKLDAAHLRQEGVAQDHEGPRLDRRPALEAVARRPRLDPRVLGQVVGQIGFARQAAAIGDQMRYHPGQKGLATGT